MVNVVGLVVVFMSVIDVVEVMMYGAMTVLRSTASVSAFVGSRLSNDVIVMVENSVLSDFGVNLKF